jgi:two-component system OmpR family sensor kinase/two-component system sensor histidine kinase BaeS
MKRLWVRLALAFIAITLIGVSSVAVLADISASQAFRQYVARRDMLVQSGILDDLAIFYQHQRSWQGVEEVLASVATSGTNGRGQRRGRPTLLLAESNGQIVYDERRERMGDTLTTEERANALPVVVKGQTVGYLVISASENGSISPAAQQFLDQLHNSLILAAFVIGGLGILLGFIISRTLTAPLSRLSQAARAFAAHNWNHRVQIGGTDEIAAVGRALNEMASELQRSERVRRDLISDIAHELRTPLTVMQGNLQALLDGVYPLDQSEIATLSDQTRLLTRLVDDLRELSLADAGQLPLQIQSVALLPLLQTSAAQFSLAAQAQNVQLTVNSDEHLPYVLADPERLAQVVRNLLANSLRHTPPGGRIQITATSHTQMCISVSDTGEGIAAGDIEHIFERFYRVEKARTRSQGSTGLGLAICKAWVEAMGGEIGVQSTVGQGSRFWVSLPLAKEAASQPPS